jgi:ferredoxin
MALLINSACTACDACRPVCPNEAISAGDAIYVIDPFKCTECVGAEDEPQCKLACPVTNCVVPNPDFSETREELLAKYSALRGGG